MKINIPIEVATKKRDKISNDDLQVDSLMSFSPIKINDRYFRGHVTLEKLHSSAGYRLVIQDGRSKLVDNLRIQYPVYHFESGDINNDGKTDILLGVIKTTHFDPVIKRRLFIYKIESGRIKPLWLGSRVCLELIDFKCIYRNKEHEILTIERNSQGLFCNGVYTWQNFGFILIRYKNENANYSTTLEYFRSKTN